MQEVEVRRILHLLDEAIARFGRSRRELERSLGFGPSYLKSLFNGRITLKVRHVYVIARELGLEPLSFFIRATPPKDPQWLLAQLEEGLEEEGISTAAAPVQPMSREEVERLVKTTLREELRRLGADAEVETERPKE